MKHVILYGPPAVGKLTVATELAALTGFPLLHNHLTNDLVRELFPYNHPEYSRLVIKFRSDLYEAAARARLEGIISTFVYAPGTEDHKILKDWIRTVKRQGGETHFVRLHCAEKTLFKRVSSPKRRSDHKKILNAKQLRYWLKNSDLLSPIPFVASLELNTDHQKGREAAKLIKRHYRL